MLIESAVWPFIYVFTGWTIMLFMQELTGVKPLTKKYVKIFHWIFIAIILAYAVICLPFWIWLIKETWVQISLLNSGMDYSYESVSPSYTLLAVNLMYYSSIAKSYIFYISIGAGLWLTKGKTKLKTI